MEIVKAILINNEELSLEKLSKYIKEQPDIKAVLFADDGVNTKISDMNTLQVLSDEPRGQDLETVVTKHMCEFGIPANLQGYQYIRTAIMMAVEDMSILNYITKKLYPEIAQKYSTTSSRAERSIRHAIEAAWKKGSAEVMNEVFGYTIQSDKGKPTNSEFIAAIADRIRLYMKRR